MKDNIIFGINTIQNLIFMQPYRVMQLFVVNNKNMRINSIINMAYKLGIPVHIGEKNITKLNKYDINHQGIVARIKPNRILSEYDIKNTIKHVKNPLILILDQIQDPHNFGACLRTANAVGITLVIIPKDNAVSITPIVSKVASGAAETVPIVQVTNLSRIMQQLKKWGIWIVGTVKNEYKNNLYNLNLSGSIALAMGSESKGLRKLTKRYCDFLVHIPMFGNVESLNVSVATGVCLYEIIRQRNNK